MPSVKVEVAIPSVSVIDNNKVVRLYVVRVSYPMYLHTFRTEPYILIENSCEVVPLSRTQI